MERLRIAHSPMDSLPWDNLLLDSLPWVNRSFDNTCCMSQDDPGYTYGDLFRLLPTMQH